MQEVRAELKSLFSMETPGGLEDFTPDDSAHFGVSVMAFIGTPGSDKVDSFDVVVCSPSWFSDHFSDSRVAGWVWEPTGVRFGNRFLFMQRWDYKTLHSVVSDLCAYREGADWGTLASRIGRHIPWEFYDEYDAFVDETAGSRPTFPPGEQP